MIQKIINIIKYCLKVPGILKNIILRNRFVFKKNKKTNFNKNEIGENSKIIVSKNDECEVCNNNFR